MSAAGKNYKSLIGDDGECNNSRSFMKWTNSSKAIENTVLTIREIIDIRDGYKECVGFSLPELDVVMLHYVLASLFFYLFVYCIIYILLITICTIIIVFGELQYVNK